VGIYNQRACYAIDLSPESFDHINPDHFLSLRSQMPCLSDVEYQLASRSFQLLTWYKQHQFCGQCGSQTSAHTSELALACTSCNLIFYPRISPCIMVLITRGDKFLLAHHYRQPNDMYSTLAGFVEAGENLEHAIHREVFEEVGIKVKNIRYSSSQSWPFPHQLMIGYFAEYDSGDIKIDDVEIQDAQWFSHDNLPTIPAPMTLSGQLIRDFISTIKT
jgi:NAD+ diphosphatase